MAISNMTRTPLGFMYRTALGAKGGVPGVAVEKMIELFARDSVSYMHGARWDDYGDAPFGGRSLNGGSTWIAQSSEVTAPWQMRFSGNKQVQMLLDDITPFDVYFSVDKGASWDSVAFANTTLDIGVAAGNDSIYSIGYFDNGVGLGYNFRVNVSSDGGASWVEALDFATGNGFISAKIQCDSEGQYAVVDTFSSSGTLYVTDDYGVTWYDRPPPAVPAGAGLRTTMSNDGSKLVCFVISLPVAGTILTEVYTSSDLGQNWSAQSWPDANYMVHRSNRYARGNFISDDGLVITHYAAPRTGLFTSDDNNPVLAVSQDGGASWSFPAETDVGASVLSVAGDATDGQNLRVALYPETNLLKSSDKGSTWSQVN